ncbi:MAG: hypothetical protein EHM13_14100 [Acidobacteria bacterium]|nr:MAG: hypothetical protein EHM13_14100 [Acidobacteriota bacterium]
MKDVAGPAVPLGDIGGVERQASAAEAPNPKHEARFPGDTPGSFLDYDHVVARPVLEYPFLRHGRGLYKARA